MTLQADMVKCQTVDEMLAYMDGCIQLAQGIMVTMQENIVKYEHCKKLLEMERASLKNGR